MEDKQPGGVRERGGRVQSGVRVDVMQKVRSSRDNLQRKREKKLDIDLGYPSV